MRTSQVCASCGREYPELTATVACEACGGLLDVRHEAPAGGRAELRATFDRRLADVGLGRGPAASGVWRFRELVLPGAGAESLVSYPEGNTPLVAHDRVAEWAGATDLLMKHEGQNPTGSFKDRGMTVALTQARRLAAPAVACASTGNTAASLAAYAALAGLPAFVVVPDGQVAAGKLAQTRAYGARVLRIRGDFDDCLVLTRRASERLGVYLVNSVNPFRLEGQKTIIFELLQQLGWDPPTWIVLPAGNLGNASAFGKALREARELGLIAEVPRLALVQASGAAPFVRSFREDFAVRHRVKAETVATAIRIGDPASYERAVRSMRDTDGVALDVSDTEILDAKRVIDSSGIGCEPASAASVAGVRKLVSIGAIGRGERVVAVLTGHLLKDPAASAPGGEATVDATEADVTQAMAEMIGR